MASITPRRRGHRSRVDWTEPEENRNRHQRHSLVTLSASGSNFEFQKAKESFRNGPADSPELLCPVTLPVAECTALVAAFATCFKALITSIAPVGRLIARRN